MVTSKLTPVKCVEQLSRRVNAGEWEKSGRNVPPEETISSTDDGSAEAAQCVSRANHEWRTECQGTLPNDD